MKVFPNPFSEIITLQSENTVYESVKVYDIFGHELMKQKMAGMKKELDLSSLSAGTYFLKLLTNDAQTVSVRICKVGL